MDAIKEAIEVFDILLKNDHAKLDLANFATRFKLDTIRQGLIKFNGSVQRGKQEND